MIKINQVTLKPGEPEGRLQEAAAKKAGIRPDQIRSFAVLRKSVDARNRDDVRFVYSVAIEAEDEKKILSRLESPVCQKMPQPAPYVQKRVVRPPAQRPVVVGLGPAGLFAGFP